MDKKEIAALNYTKQFPDANIFEYKDSRHPTSNRCLRIETANYTIALDFTVGRCNKFALLGCNIKFPPYNYAGVYKYWKYLDNHTIHGKISGGCIKGVLKLQNDDYDGETRLILKRPAKIIDLLFDIPQSYSNI